MTRASCNTSAAKAKLNELFIQWLTLPDTQDQLGSVLEQRAKRPRIQIDVVVEEENETNHNHHNNSNSTFGHDSFLHTTTTTTCTSTAATATTTTTMMVTTATSSSPESSMTDSIEEATTPLASASMHFLNNTNSGSPSSSSSSSALELTSARRNSPPPRSPTSNSNSSPSSLSASLSSSSTTTTSAAVVPSTDLQANDPLSHSLAHRTALLSDGEDALSLDKMTVDSALNNESTNQKKSPASPTLSFANVPRFYFPTAGLAEHAISAQDRDLIQRCFASKDSYSFSDFPDLFDALFHDIFPFYFTTLLFVRIDVGNTGSISQSMVESFWRRCMAEKSTTDRFYYTIKNPATPKAKGLVSEDFFPIMNELLEIHPGLAFLKGSGFQECYAETVLIRIFYAFDRRGLGYITLQEFRKNTLVNAFNALAHEEDINKIRDFFSYEHFYVLYCKFWALDTNHDSLIDINNLMKYSNYSLTLRILGRIFSGAARKLTGENGMMTYEDFVWFCISEEDKTSDTSLEYWFRCVDLDCDGCISGFEIEYFFNEQLQRMAKMSQEVISLDDILAQMIDMIKPADPRRITLKDLKQCKMAGVFFNALFNLNKFILYESRNPFSIQQEHNSTEQLSDWDKFARVEYDLLAHGQGDEDEISTIGEAGFESSPTDMEI